MKVEEPHLQRVVAPVGELAQVRRRSAAGSRVPRFCRGVQVFTVVLQLGFLFWSALRAQTHGAETSWKQLKKSLEVW